MRYDVPGVDGVLYVQRFEEKDDKGKYKKPKEKGYVPAKKVTKGAYKHVDVGNDVPIFDDVPSVADTQQGAIGDCYLIAALASVVRTNPKFIYDMINDDGSGNITVRLFDDAAPTYVQVKKSLVTGGRHSEKALWVPFVEKAYAAYFSGSYSQMEGGKMSEAWSRLTGQGSEHHEIDKESGLIDKSSVLFWEQKNVGDGMDKLGTYGIVQKFYIKKPEMLERSAPYKILGDKPKALEFIDWLVTSKNLSLIKKFRVADMANNITAFNQVLDDFKEVGDLDESIKQAVVDLIPKLYGGDKAGQYTGGQEELFTKVKNALDAGKYVGSGTPTSLPEKSGSS